MNVCLAGRLGDSLRTGQGHCVFHKTRSAIQALYPPSSQTQLHSWVRVVVPQNFPSATQTNKEAGFNNSATAPSLDYG